MVVYGSVVNLGLWLYLHMVVKIYQVVYAYKELRFIAYSNKENKRNKIPYERRESGH